MKTIRLSIYVFIMALCMILYSCTSSIDKQMDFAETKFIEEVAYMDEKEALSKEIDYYKAPQITVRKHIRTLTGKDLIHECNKVIKENEERRRSKALIIRTVNVSDIKQYALEHPEDIVANEFEFSGTFTHFGQDKYGQRTAIVIVIPKLERYILKQIY